MGMAVGGTSSYNSEINVTPMVDIMLVLLIIFMVVTPLLQQGISVALPREMRNPDEDPNIIKESSVVLAITQDGQIYFKKERIDKADLKAKVDSMMENKTGPDRIVYIRSDINANYGAVVDLINSVRESGIDQIGLVADKKKGGGAAPAATAPAPAS
ncbi:MAG TPA: biopolymer transporter ExbD [Pyrinomonadaceae bacterium]|nr:biopolymer transporter ExbD [Pyrinomonadaceae bacterium]